MRISLFVVYANFPQLYVCERCECGVSLNLTRFYVLLGYTIYRLCDLGMAIGTHWGRNTWAGVGFEIERADTAKGLTATALSETISLFLRVERNFTY